MIERLVLFGATGDLAARYLFPALGAMLAAGRLPGGFTVTGCAREDLTAQGFRGHVADALDTYAPDLPSTSRLALLDAVRYLAVDSSDPGDVARAIRLGDADSPLAAYLALPPELFPDSIAALGTAGMPKGSRIAIEKPFGTSLGDARSLNALVEDVFGDLAERMIFRVDHVLGMATVQNLVGLRTSNPVLDMVWNSRAIERVEVLWEEVLGLEDRAGYFDETGALKDVMQNHMLQVLAVVAMEPPASLGEHDLREAKVQALQAVRSPDPDAMAERTRRARYRAGMLAASQTTPARPVPAYLEEAGVDPGRGTETFAEVTVEIDTPRWRGTRFVLRGGKALAERRKGVLIRFRSATHALPADPAHDWSGSTLWLGIDQPNEISLRLIGMSALPAGTPVPVVLAAPPPPAELPPYGNVLLDLLSGNSRLSVRGDEAVAAWRIVTPVLQAWADGLVPLEEYPAGAPGLTPRT